MTVQQAVRNASSTAIKDAMQQLRDRHFPWKHWLGVRNHYALDTIARIKQDTNSGRTPVSSQLSEYIAASAILHCFDGWSYLAHAVESLFDGDTATAVHLAYYAELRASMSFLASDGIGVFSNQHCWVDSAGAGHFFNGPGTHAFVWEAVKEWAAFPAKSVRLLDLFQVGGRSFTEWLHAAGYPRGSIPTTRLARHWLEDWSLDLDVLEDDRHFRNEASYRPQRMRTCPSQMPLIEALRRVIEFWQVCEPSASERFSLLDRYLLRHALKATYQMRTGRAYLGKAFERFVESAMANLGLSASSVLKDFLVRRRARVNHPLLVEAKKKGQAGNRVLRPLSIIARAILLLRMASAAAEDLLSSQAVTLSDLDFWWRDLGENIGLWESGAAPGQMVDLWADIQPVINDVVQWCNTPNTTSASAIQTRQDRAFELWQLTQFQRAGLWAIGL